ncbi:hypothetical protein FOZ62_002436, partial [Perkinsus olseni]
MPVNNDDVIGKPAGYSPPPAAGSDPSTTTSSAASSATGLLVLPVESRQAAGQEENSGLLPIVSRTSQEYLKLAIESHEGSGGSTIAGSEADEDEEAMIASLCYDAPGDKTARGASKFLLGLPQNFMAASTDTEDSDVESPGGERPKTVRFGCGSPGSVMVKNDSSGELSKRTASLLRRYRSSSVVTVVHVYDGVEYDGEEEVESDDGFDEAMFLNDADDDDSCSEKEEEEEEAPKPPVLLRRAQSAPANVLLPRSRMASDGDV